MLSRDMDFLFNLTTQFMSWTEKVKYSNQPERFYGLEETRAGSVKVEKAVRNV